MAELFAIEFEGVTADDYRRVNSILGLDPFSGEGEWPQGLLSHAAGETKLGWQVLEVWESQEAQEEFMEARLAQALREAGVQPPVRSEWTTLHAHHTPRRKSQSH
jgi:hypothetical protein